MLVHLRLRATRRVILSLPPRRPSRVDQSLRLIVILSLRMRVKYLSVLQPRFDFPVEMLRCLQHHR